MALPADGKRQLGVGHYDDGGSTSFIALHQLHTQRPRRAEGLADELLDVRAPLHHINSLATKFVDDRLDTHPPHSHARTHGVHARLKGGDGYLGAEAGFAGDRLDLNRSVVYLRNLELQQALEHSRVRPRQDDLGAARGSVDL